MYYITNQNGQVIAASSDLLTLLEAENIDALCQEIARDAINFKADDDSVTLKTLLEERCYRTEKEELFSLLGSMTLVRLVAEISTRNDEEIAVETDLSTQTVQKEDPFLLLEEDALFEIKEENNEEKPKPTEHTQSEEKQPVYIDVPQAAQSIGISEEDYHTFLAEYIQTALSLEEDLKGDDTQKRTAAVHTLFHLSNVLRLPAVADIVEEIKESGADDRAHPVERFYNTLSRLTTLKAEIPTEGDADTEARQTGAENREHGTIDLSGVTPVHFDFQVEQAARDLSLPPELIEEFIQDFIKQAHEETEKMLKAYEKGDYVTIQKIGHLLKGTAANLRINPLSDTLYEIQFCEDPDKLEDLIKEYWAHFISFEKQFNLTSQNK